MKYKLTILVMSCNSDFFKHQNDIIRNTWGKDHNVIFYEGNHKENKLVGDVLELRCPDAIEYTLLKTVTAFKYLREHSDFDYIFRTNTSTYVNVPLLEKFTDTLQYEDVMYSSELYSLSEGLAPYPLAIYGRGNGLLIPRHLIDVLIRESINFQYMPVVDDMYIGNILNSYFIKQGANYLDHIKSLTHGWYRCIDEKFDSGHKLCRFGEEGDAKFYSDFVTIQIKCYRQREKEEEHYLALHEIMKNIKEASDESVTKAIEYAKDPSIFVGSAIGYLDYSKWLMVDKNKLFHFELSHKANDDEEHYKHWDKQVWKADPRLAKQRIAEYKKF